MEEEVNESQTGTIQKPAQAPQDELPTEVGASPETLETQDTQNDRSELEQEARALGWDPDFKPKKKYQKAFSAEEFLQHREEIREKKQLKTELESLRKQIAEQQNFALQSVQGLEQEQRQKEISAIKARQRQAVRDGDEQLYDQLDRHRETLEKAPLRTQAQSQMQAQQVRENPIMTDFIRDNPWYQEDQELAEYANYLGTKVSQEGYSGKALLKEVARQVKATRPDKFRGRSGQSGANYAVEATEGATPNLSSGSAARLPPDIKAEHDRYCQTMLDAKIVKSKAEASKRFMTTYKNLTRN